jgi:hypothetical protein
MARIFSNKHSVARDEIIKKAISWTVQGEAPFRLSICGETSAGDHFTKPFEEVSVTNRGLEPIKFTISILGEHSVVHTEDLIDEI